MPTADNQWERHNGMAWCLRKFQKQFGVDLSGLQFWWKFDADPRMLVRESEGSTDPPPQHTAFWLTALSCRRSSEWLRPLLVLLAWSLSAVAAQCQESGQAKRPTLTHVAQVRGMTIREARRGYPVRIRGIVTYYNWDGGDLFIQDSTAGIWVNPGDTKLSLHSGELVQVEGTSGVGDFAPEIDHARFRSLGEAPLPEPRRPTSDDLASGRQDSQWIELQGVVRSVAERDGGLVLNLSSGAFECSVFVLKYPSLPTDIKHHRHLDHRRQSQRLCGNERLWV
jgi:hypothetical protein